MFKILLPFEHVIDKIADQVDDLDSWLGISLEGILTLYLEAFEKNGQRDLEIEILLDIAEDIVSRQIIFYDFQHGGDIEQVKDLLCEVFEEIDVGLARTFSNKPKETKWVLDEVSSLNILVLHLENH